MSVSELMACGRNVLERELFHTEQFKAMVTIEHSLTETNIGYTPILDDERSFKAVCQIIQNA